ncbi:binding protein msmE [Anaerobacillus alkalilacustris]|uniref:Binding protein msmE n=1 Tax=Anaerobacillus alkalilacustris TaxID=393763 RepID=A0A1S2LXK0_9BACI|nr:extracellular solute-binding protein [Anaerobacillus alkalilacustris]OIJ17044.1 binding protein msmE [Anaerobacillus alkalilacustris]
MKKLFGSIITFALISVLMIGCSSNNEVSNNETDSTDASNQKQVTLELFTTLGSDLEQEAFETVIAAFTEEYPHIKIDANYPGGGYEDLLRVKMAANDMPDLFDTHGWSQLRYGEYVADLQDMAWVEHLDPAMDQILKDETGKVYAYPLNQAKDGYIYNASLLDEYGIEAPTTFDDFIEALKTIKEKSNGEVTPLFFGGGESWTLAQFVDQMLTPLLITHPDNAFGDQLLDGSFDWSNFTYLAEKFKEIHDEGLLNTDVLTARHSQAAELLAQGKVGFLFTGAAIGMDAVSFNPDLKVGIAPTPAVHTGDTPSWIGGERFTLAAWKASEKLEEAKLFIDFISQPEHAKALAEATSLPAALTNVSTDNYFNEYFDTFSDIEIQPYFDRVFLPSGMWDVMATTSAELLAGTMTPEQVTKVMEDEYNRLRNQ